MDFSGFNFWEVLVAALSGFLIGGIWYSSRLFGKAWQKEAGLTDDDLKGKNLALVFGLSFVFFFLIALILSVFVEIFLMVGSSALLGGFFSAVLALLFVATSFGINYLFAQKSLRLYLIDVGYLLIAFFVMGLIIGAWY